MLLRARRPARRIVSPLIAGAVFVVASTAGAQTYQRPILTENSPILDPADRRGEDQPGVMTREYPDFTPPGIAVGGFIFNPRLSTDIGYSDNIYARPQSTKASAIGTLSPEATLTSNWSRHDLTIAAHGDIKRYASAKTENMENYRVAAGGRLDLGSDGALIANARRERLHELRGDPDSPARTAAPTLVDQTGGDLAYTQGLGPFAVRLGGFVRQDQYQNSVGADGRLIDGGSRSLLLVGERARLSYDVSPDFTLFGEGGWTNRRYDHPAGNGLKSRNSSGPEVGGGASFALGALWSGEIAMGYAERTIDDDRFGSVSALTARAQLLWNVTRSTSLRAQALRNIGETSGGPSVAYIGTTYWFGIEHQLQSDLLLGANVSTRNLDYARSNDETDVLSVGARATWLINRNFRAQAEYNFSRRDGSASDTNFDRNIGMLRFVSSF